MDTPVALTPVLELPRALAALCAIQEPEGRSAYSPLAV